MTTLFILCTACGKISRVTTGDFLSRSGITRQTFLHSTHQPFCCGRCTSMAFSARRSFVALSPIRYVHPAWRFRPCDGSARRYSPHPGRVAQRHRHVAQPAQMADASNGRAFGDTQNFASSHIKSSVSGGRVAPRAAKSHPRRSAGRSGSVDRSADSRRSRRFGCRLAVETLLVSRLRARWSGRRCSGAHLPRKAQRWRRSGRWSGRRRSARTVLPAADRPATAN